MDLKLSIKQAGFRFAPGLSLAAGMAASKARRGEIKLIRALTKPGMNALDIGASFGLYTYVMAEIAAHVDAFEPNPAKAAYLRSLSLKRTTIHAVALSDGARQTELVYPEGMSALGTMDGANPLFHDRAAVHVPIETQTLDSFGFTNIGFIKIDVEGHEVPALRGAGALLTQQKPRLYIEAEKRHNPPLFEPLFAELAALGYQAYCVVHNRVAAMRFFDVVRDQSNIEMDRGIAQGTYIYNFLFLQPGDDGLDILRREGFDIAL